MPGFRLLDSCKRLVQPVQPAADAAVPHVAPHADAQAADQIWIYAEISGQPCPVLAAQVPQHLLARVRAQRRRALDDRMPLVQLQPDQPMVILQDIHVMPRLPGHHLGYESAHLVGIELAIGEACLKQLFRDLAYFLSQFHVGEFSGIVG